MGKTDEKVFDVFEAHADEFDISAPTLKQLAVSTGLSPSSVQRAIRALIRTGRLERVTKGGGVGMSSVYRIHRISTGPESRHLNLVTEPSQNLVTVSDSTLNKPSQEPHSAPIPLKGDGGGAEGSRKIEERADDQVPDDQWHPSQTIENMRTKLRRAQARSRSIDWLKGDR